MTTTQRVLALNNFSMPFPLIAAILSITPAEVEEALAGVELAEPEGGGGGSDLRIIEGEGPPTVEKPEGWLYIDKENGALYVTAIYAWAANVPYLEGELVGDDGTIFKALAAVTSETTPSEDPGNWVEAEGGAHPAGKNNWQAIGGAGNARSPGLSSDGTTTALEFPLELVLRSLKGTPSILILQQEADGKGFVGIRTSESTGWTFDSDGTMESPFAFEQHADPEGAAPSAGLLWRNVDTGAVFVSITPPGWETEGFYRAGVVVTHAGKSWVSNAEVESREEPPEANGKWAETNEGNANWVKLLGVDENGQELQRLHVRLQGDQLAPSGLQLFVNPGAASNGELVVGGINRFAAFQDSSTQNYLVTFSTSGTDQGSIMVWRGGEEPNEEVIWWIVQDGGWEAANSLAPPTDDQLEVGSVYGWWEDTDGAAKFIRRGKTADGTVVQTVSDMVPPAEGPEHGLTGELEAGEHAIAAPHVTMTGTILLTVEGPAAISAVVKKGSREPGTGFTIIVTGAGKADINWSVTN